MAHLWCRTGLLSSTCTQRSIVRKDNHRIRLAISRLSVTTCATILTVWRGTGHFGHVGKGRYTGRSADGEKVDETSGEQARNYLGSPHNR